MQETFPLPLESEMMQNSKFLFVFKILSWFFLQDDTFFTTLLKYFESYEQKNFLHFFSFVDLLGFLSCLRKLKHEM